MVVIGGQTRRLAYGAIDVEHQAAVTTDQVVMVIAYSVFISGNGTGRLYATNETLFNEDAQRVVHGLARDRTNSRPHSLDQFVGRCMWVRRDSFTYCQSLRCDVYTTVAHLLLSSPTHRPHSIIFSVLSQEFDLVWNLPNGSLPTVDPHHVRDCQPGPCTNHELTIERQRHA
jgi:hypothetical protein